MIKGYQALVTGENTYIFSDPFHVRTAAVRWMNKELENARPRDNTVEGQILEGQFGADEEWGDRQ